MVTCITWNVNSFPLRFKHIILLLRDRQPDILMLQEIRTQLITNEHKNSITEAGYDLFISYSQVNGRSGVATLIKSHLNHKAIVVPTPTFQGRMLILHTEIGFMINVYAPFGINKRDICLKKIFFKTLSSYIYHICKQKLPILLGGDFNICVLPSDSFHILSPGHPLLHSASLQYYYHISKHGLIDSFMSQAFSFSKHYRYYTIYPYQLGSKPYRGYRIDTIMHSMHYACVHISLLYSYRFMPQPSDHLPVFMRFKRIIILKKNS